MADPALVKQNMQRMLEQGASPAEVEEYARLEGVTPEQANPRTVLESVGDFIGELDENANASNKRAREAFVGKQDPKFKDLPEFPAEAKGTGIHTPVKGFNDAALLTDNDKDYASILKRDLEKAGRFIGTEKDANGYEILTYRGDDGKEYVAYVNKPGFGMTDVNRELAAMLPAAIAGFGMSALAKKVGMGLFGRVTTVGTGESTTAGGRDVVAAQRGAEFDPVNTLMKMALSGAGGALFEGLSGPVTRAWRKIFSSKAPPVDASGNLTTAGRKAAVSAGLDPDDMNVRLAAALQDKLKNAADPLEAGVDIRTGEFGIPTTKGQRTKDPTLLGREKDLSRGVYGPEAAEIIGTSRGPKKTGFYGDQSAAIDRAVNDSVGMSLAPRQAGREPATLNSRIKEGARESKKIWDAEEDRLWGETGPMYPDLAYRQSTLYPILGRKLAGKSLVPTPETKQAHQMMILLEDYANNRITKPPYEALTQESEYSVDEMRRRLYGLMDGADPGSYDKKVAAEIYGAYDEWLEDLARQGAMTGTPEEVAKLKLARGFSRGVKELFAPRVGGKPTPAAARIQTIIEDSKVSNSTDVVNALIPSSPKAGTPKGTEQALRHLKGILHVAGDVGEDTWNDVRLAYWTRLTMDKRGDTLSPKMLRDNIRAALHNQEGVVGILYSEEERKTFRRLVKVLDDVISVDPNPSGTAHELARMTQDGVLRGAAKTFTRTKQASSTFAKHDFLMARVYQQLTKALTVDPIGARTGMGAKLARRATDPRLTPKPGSSLIAPIGSIGAEEFIPEEYPEEVR